MNSAEEQVQEAKIQDLLQIFRERPINLTKLQNFGRVYGFINDYGRNLAWNEIFEKLPQSSSTKENENQNQKEIILTEEETKKRKYQIHIDVNRAMNFIDFYVNLPEDQM